MSATNQAEQTALTLPQRAAVALGESANEAKLRELVSKSAGIVAVTNADGREEAHRAGMVLLKTRTGIEKTGKTAREDAQAFSKAVIAMEKDLIGIIHPEETRVLGLRDAWDEKIAAEKAAKIAAERARTEAIQADIAAIRDTAMGVAGKSSAVIRAAIDILEEIEPTEARFGEFAADALMVASGTIDKLVEMFESAKASEAAALAAEVARKAAEKKASDEAEAVAKQKEENERVAAELAAAAKALADQQAAQALAAKEAADKAAAELKRQQEAQAAAQRKAAEEIQRGKDELAAQVAAHAAAIADQAAAVQLLADHAEALEMNAALDTVKPRLAAIEVPVFTQPDDLARHKANFASFEQRHRESVEAYEAAGLDQHAELFEDLTSAVRGLIAADYSADEIRGAVERALLAKP
ncbi:MAG TPA: hypothetical protein VFS02_20190 [Telluria sp.]|nr:hypothetical protein [Telluria sp.]